MSKKRKKKEAEKRKKYQRRVDMKMIHPGDDFDVPQEDELFSLRNADQENLDHVRDVTADFTEQKSKDEDINNESDVDEENYLDTVEDYLDKMYDQYLDRNASRSEKTKIQKERKKRKKTRRS